MTSQHIALLLDEASLTVDEVASSCAVSREWVVEHVQAGVLLDEAGPDPGQWAFTGRDLLRARRLYGLERDFDANPELAGLFADLFDELERLGELPNCGKCRQPLFAGKPVELNAAGFDRHLGRNDIPLLVDFWAPWCGPCRMMAPAFEQAASQLEPYFRLAKVNTENEPALAARYGIRSIPTLAVFLQGREVAHQPGAMGMSDIVRWARAAAG